MSHALPFDTAHVWESTEAGAVPSGILGKVFFDPKNGNHVMVVKNTDGSVISGCELCAWEDADQHEVHKTLTSGTTLGAGIAHPDLATRGKTVPINAAFLVVRTGPTTCLAGAAITPGDKIVADGTDGRIQTALNASAGVYGICHESGSAGAASVFCDVNFPAS